jgi:hypothetical protein
VYLTPYTPAVGATGKQHANMFACVAGCGAAATAAVGLPDYLMTFGCSVVLGRQLLLLTCYFTVMTCPYCLAVSSMHRWVCTLCVSLATVVLLLADLFVCDIAD